MNLIVKIFILIVIFCSTIENHSIDNILEVYKTSNNKYKLPDFLKEYYQAIDVADSLVKIIKEEEKDNSIDYSIKHIDYQNESVVSKDFYVILFYNNKTFNDSLYYHTNAIVFPSRFECGSIIPLRFYYPFYSNYKTKKYARNFYIIDDLDLGIVVKISALEINNSSRFYYDRYYYFTQDSINFIDSVLVETNYTDNKNYKNFAEILRVNKGTIEIPTDIQDYNQMHLIRDSIAVYYKTSIRSIDSISNVYDHKLQYEQYIITSDSIFLNNIYTKEEFEKHFDTR
ncbi:MAG: hypothetical protein Kapaf2KO_11920 [Candidatus Kapaibacteriales bacterium]